MSVWQPSRIDRSRNAWTGKQVVETLMVISLTLAPLAVRAVRSEGHPPPSAAQSVESLMRLEAELLGVASSGQDGTLASDPTERRGRQEAPELMALYGVGRGLTAEVRVAGRRYLYAAGQSWPLAASSGHAPYQLLDIAAPCIVLLRDDTQHKSCLPSWASGRP